jgi:hypothetical protein
MKNPNDIPPYEHPEDFVSDYEFIEEMDNETQADISSTNPIL